MFLVKFREKCSLVKLKVIFIFDVTKEIGCERRDITKASQWSHGIRVERMRERESSIYSAAYFVAEFM